MSTIAHSQRMQPQAGPHQRRPARRSRQTPRPPTSTLTQFWVGVGAVALLVAIVVFSAVRVSRAPAPAPDPTPAPVPVVERAPEARTLSAAPTSPDGLPGVVTATLEKVVDGDTIWVRIAGQRYKVRYLGIDTPESTRHTSKGIEYLGKRAGERNAALLKGRALRLELDGPRTDRFGRLLAYVWAGDTLVNAALLRAGLARVYRKAPNISRYAAFVAMEQSATRRGIGIWNERGRERWERSQR